MTFVVKGEWIPTDDRNAFAAAAAIGAPDVVTELVGEKRGGVVAVPRLA